jgi:hypothetical protein
VIGNRFYLASGMMQSAGALAMQDPKLQVDTSAADILELPGAPNAGANGEKKVSGRGERKPHTRYDVKSADGQKMLEK